MVVNNLKVQIVNQRIIHGDWGVACLNRVLVIFMQISAGYHSLDLRGDILRSNSNVFAKTPT